MNGWFAAACRLCLIYGVPFAVIVIADKLPSMQGYSSPIIFVCLAWMFGFHFLINGNAKRDGDR